MWYDEEGTDEVEREQKEEHLPTQQKYSLPSASFFQSSHSNSPVLQTSSHNITSSVMASQPMSGAEQAQV